MLHRRPSFHPPRSQLRTDILEYLLHPEQSSARRSASAEELSLILGVQLAVMKAELFKMRLVHLVSPVLIEFETGQDNWYRDWKIYYELSEHARSHTDINEHFQCAGCQVRRLSKYIVRP